MSPSARTNDEEADPRAAEPAAEGSRISSSRTILTFLAGRALFIGLILLFVVFWSVNDSFLTVANLRNVSLQSSYVSVAAVPMACLVIAGKIDLSVGSVLALGGVTTGMLITHGVNPVVAVTLAVVAGAAVGTINGVLVTGWKLSPIIVTLGALTSIRGFVLWLSPGPLFDFGDAFVQLGDGKFLGIPYLVLIAAAVYLIGAIVLSQAPVGRHIYAIGVNQEAAYLSGVRVTWLEIGLFVASGTAAAIAGVMLAARLGSAPSGTMGVGFELDVLTAVLLGGVAFSGGRGSIGGVLLGVVFLGILQNGLTLQNVPAAIAAIIKGAVLVGAAGLDRIAVRAATNPRRVRALAEAPSI